MEREDVFRYLGDCFFGEPASCTFACPFRLDLRAFLKKMARGRFDAAYRELCTVIPFPEVCAQLCGETCAAYCQYASVLGGEAIRIRALEKSCLHLAKRKQPPVYALPEKTQTAAVIGAGPVGLSGALTLCRKKYRVTVFEKDDRWGGSLREHPSFEDFDRDFSLQFSQEQCSFVFRHEVRSAEELSGFDAVLVASGDREACFGLSEGWDAVLCSTARPGFFLCGAAAGQSLMEGMASAVRCATSIEAYIQTKNPENARDGWDPSKACRYVPHEGIAAVDAVPFDAGDSYGAVRAKEEAGRCLQCECRECMNVCELMQTYKKSPPRVASDVLQDGEARNSVSSAAITRETWSCNLCGRCAEKCVVGTDIGSMLQLSRARRVGSRLYPPAIHAYWMEEMGFASGEASLLIPGSGGYAFFPGCRLGAANPEYVLKSFELLQRRLGAGLLLNCCGIPAWWAGEEQRFQAHLAQLRQQWESLGRPTLVLACASCGRLLRRFLPEIPLASLYSLLPEDMAVGLPEYPEAAVFDPCAASDWAEKDAVRSLVRAAGTKTADFDSDGKCCGFGGHMQLANPRLYAQITENRTAAAEQPYAVWCTNCMDTFLARGKDSVHVLDLYFGLHTGLSSLEQKRENALKLKAALMEAHGMARDEAVPEPWDALGVECSEELARKMDAILIPLRYVRRVLWQSERDGSGFSGPDGQLLVSLDLDAVTVWVRARRLEDGTYSLLDVYSHRMRVSGGEL